MLSVRRVMHMEIGNVCAFRVASCDAIPMRTLPAAPSRALSGRKTSVAKRAHGHTFSP